MIIDTMVVAYALLGVPEYGDESLAALRKAEGLYAPASIEAELLNVFWQWGRRGIAPDRVAEIYGDAARLWTRLIPVQLLWTDALFLANASGHSPYDTLFIAAARLLQSAVVTYDRKMLMLFPEDTITVGDFLAL